MERTHFINVTVGVITVSQTVLGILGNFSLLYHCLFLYCTGNRVRVKDLILMHLTMSNFLVIVFNGVPKTMTIWGLEYIFSDLGCILVSYVQRVVRGVSIGTTCLLSVSQAIMISPMNSWKNLKVKVPQYVTISIFLYWIFCIFIHLFFPLHKLYVSSKWNLESFTNNKERGYCYVTCNEHIFIPVYAGLIVLPEVMLSVLIVWASVSMILFLHRHKQRVQHIHSNHVSPRSSAETRATQRILVLVSTFVCFFTLSSVYNVCIILLYNPSRVLLDIANILSLFFPIVSPFLVTTHDTIVSKLSFVLRMSRQSHDLTHGKKGIFWRTVQFLTPTYCWEK